MLGGLIVAKISLLQQKIRKLYALWFFNYTTTTPLSRQIHR